MTTFYAIYARCKHFIEAKHRQGHGIHSPYLFRFLNQVLFERKEYYCYKRLKQARKKLYSKTLKQHFKPEEIDRLIHRICVDTKAKTIVEIGSNIGLTSIYAAKTDTIKTSVYSFEQDDALADIAILNYKEFDCKNIEIIKGNINDNLEGKLEKIDPIDVLICNLVSKYTSATDIYKKSAEHTHNDSIFIFYGIHDSKENEIIWKEIINSSKPSTTVDAYHIGIVWFNPYLEKRNFKVAI